MVLGTSRLDTTGFFISKDAEGISRETVADYTRSFGYFQEWLELNPQLTQLTPADLKAFLAWLRQRPSGLAPDHPVSSKTVRNAWVALKSYYRWLSEETGAPNLMATVKAPKVPEPVIEPLTHEQVDSLLRACEYARTSQRPGQKPFTKRRPTATRDRAILLTLLDSGLRASELCNLKVENLDVRSGKIFVLRGKGGKGRIVYVGKTTRKALWRYLATREEAKPADPLFLTTASRPFDRDRLQHLIVGLGERAGVKLHPHALRHTFATEFLRNGGNLLGLQRLLGHSSLEMVRRYAAIAEADLARAHETGSPADRWRL